MPKNLTDASSWDPQTAPTGTDIRNAAGVESHMQPAANRARFLYDRTNPLADIAALKAIAAPSDNIVRLVEKYGFYIFDSASAAAESLPWVVQPTVGTGRWIHSLFTSFSATLGAASGVATLDGATKLAGAQRVGWLVATYSAKLASSFTTASASFVDAGALTVSATGVAVGDILVVDAVLQATITAGTGDGKMMVGGSDVGAYGRWSNTGTETVIPMQAHVVASGAGTYVAKVQIKGTGGTAGCLGNASDSFQRSSIRLLHFRP